MKVLYVEGLASHDGPESCGGAREGGGEALTGERAGRVLSREKLIVRGADAVEKSGRQHGTAPSWRARAGPCAVRDLAHARKPPAREPGDPWTDHGSSRDPGPHREGYARNPMMHGQGKSDPPIVPVKSPNNAAHRGRGGDGGKGRGQGQCGPGSTRQTQSRESVSQALDRIREAARRDKRVRFTALLHHVTVDLLHWSFHQLKRQAAPASTA